MPGRFLRLSILVVALITAGVTAYRTYRPNAARLEKFYQWMRNPASRADWKLTAGTQCGSAPFIFPTDGFVGFLWGDSFGPRDVRECVAPDALGSMHTNSVCPYERMVSSGQCDAPSNKEERWMKLVEKSF